MILNERKTKLLEAGFDLTNGAIICVHVDQCRPVQMIAEERHWKRRHLVISPDLEQRVEHIIRSLPNKDKVRIKSREAMSGLDLHVKQEKILAETARTFLTVNIPSSLRSQQRAAGTSSTTDANFRKGRNPRKV
mmetsp:Transcript_21039/g.44859  ORF Transcript_21039/g.44859 Transcript_21039/m.44859 type:complete len:134 (-) Transcript_21039:129-530(-)